MESQPDRYLTSRKSRRVLYAHLTELALTHTTSPLQAWENAVQTLAAQGIGTASSRAKGCPKAAFVGLAEHGYVHGFAALSYKPLGESASYALCAYNCAMTNPSLQHRKGDWATAVAECGHSRKYHNGVLDVVAALIQHNAFLPTAETASP